MRGVMLLSDSKSLTASLLSEPPITSSHRSRLLPVLSAVSALVVAALLISRSAALGVSAADGSTNAAGGPLRVATVVVTFFAPEFRPWRHYFEDTETLAFVTPEPLLYSERLRALVVCTGMGPRQSSAAVTALGFDPRFNLSEAVWLISGIAGIDPARGSVGSVVLADQIVDMAVAAYIDRAEPGFPSSWSTGWLPLTCTEPFCRGHGSQNEARAGQIAFELDATLVGWAARRASAVALPDAAALQATRAPFGAAGYAVAAQPPAVLRGDTLSGATVWVGFAALAWARQWVSYWTGGRGVLHTSAMEDSAVAVAMRLLHRAGRANSSRLLSLRAAANFCTQPPDVAIGDFVAGFGAADRSDSKRDGGSNNNNNNNDNDDDNDTIFWDPGRDPVSSAAAANVHLVAAELVRAIAASEHPQ